MAVIDFTKNNSSMRTKVYEFLKEEIVSLKLSPGLSISENETAERLQVSRTPVREAFLKLSQEGLVTVFPQKGSVVSLIDLEHLEETRFMREQLEVAAAKLACEKITDRDFITLSTNLELQKQYISEKRFIEFYELDDEFHSILFSVCNKMRIWNVIQNMMSINFNRVRHLSLTEKLNTDKIILQHHDILEAIKMKDTCKAEKVVREHLRLVTTDREELKMKYPDFFN